MKKTILYISYDGMTDPLGQSQVLPYLVGLSKEGYEFTLLSFEKKKRYEQNKTIIQKICTENNIRWIPEMFSTRPPVLSKIYDNWRMKKKSLQLHKEFRFDFIHCRSYVAAAAGLYLKRRCKLPFLFDMRGFWVDERVDNGQWNLKNPIYRLFYKIYKQKERKYFKESAHIISLTENGKEELVTNYSVSEDKISVIPCCVDLAHFDYTKISEDEINTLRQKHHIEKDDKILTYLGSLGGWYLTDEMLDFFKLLKEKKPASKFLFITQNKKEEVLSKAVPKGILENDIIVVPAGRNEVPGLLALSRWSIFFIKDAYSKKASSPTKQGEIMAMGIPIICNDIGDTGRIVESGGTGIVLKNFSDATLRAAIVNLSSIQELTKKQIRESAFVYYDLRKGIEVYKSVYHLLAQ
ncbi:MAG: glycosyltransferase family 4 protein [Bacteroidetes bacterium]|nr:glycosyltransferase family 4 protein [Bacteroidota bacterium]